ncbi:replication-relaxation family protein [Mesorhizobium sp. B1-1-8]|uniref:replication-relaxation family protein n=1 Tax=Mesorhizobium sp. B1-1-8 TaxID=2589976 RepID=UPI0015E41342|nr:replication-relaxation family protein [Mesorhizobium sp. B1-1-8]UCI07372.1 replication-relaxation family protein [Mesorhizobium sp. B1-1-8]
MAYVGAMRIASPKAWDSLQRRMPVRPVSTGKFITAMPRDLFLFERLNWHGPLPSPYLIEYSRYFGHKSIGRARDRLTDLGHEQNTAHGGRYLDKPAAQYPQLPGGYVPRNHTNVYALTAASKKALAEAGRLVSTTHAGWWDHQLMVSCVTASIELAILANPSLGFIPRHQAIGDRQLSAVAPFTHGGRSHSLKLIPDQLFGIRYGDKKLYFLLEVDRSTELVSHGSFERKSFLRSFLQYRHFVGGQTYKQHYGIEEGMVVLFLTTTERQLQNMIDLVMRVTEGKGNNYVLFRCESRFATKGALPSPILDLVAGRWRRAGKGDLSLREPE